MTSPLKISRIMLTLLCVGLLCACGVIDPGPTPTPNPLSGTVTLTAPPEGAVIYASALYVAGTLTDVPAKNLLVQLVDEQQAIIAQAAVNASGSSWSTEIIHGYTGDPAQVTVQVVPAEAPTVGILASTQIVFAPLRERPEGAFVNVLTPEDGVEVGGDEIFVAGTASGIPENSFKVELIGSSGEILASQFILLAGRYPIDEIPWSTTLQPGEYRGNALLKITFPDGTEQISAVIIGASAG